MGTLINLLKPFEPLSPIKFRIDKLDGMTASDVLSESESRQLVFDIESSYNAFDRVLHTNS